MIFSRSPSSQKTAVKPKGVKKSYKQHQQIIRPNICLGNLILSNQQIQSLNNYQIPNTVTSINLSYNPISDLTGFPLVTNLLNLDLSNTQIANLKGIPTFPNLKTISVDNTPFNNLPTCKLAILLSQTSNLKKINGSIIISSERQIASRFPPDCTKLVKLGWIPQMPPPSQEVVDQIKISMVERRKAERVKIPQKQTTIKKDTVAKKESTILQEQIDEQNKELQDLKSQIDALMAKQSNK